MEIYRIESAERQDEALSGMGAELFGGRWNRIGERAVYCASHRSLAMLEILAHVRSKALFPVNRIIISIELPVERIFTLKLNDLQVGWDAPASYWITEGVFEQYCLLKNRLAIRVPSVIVPEEYNLVLNPGHAKFKQVKILSTKKLVWDDRLI
jgi:RES domain-containing protein